MNLSSSAIADCNNWLAAAHGRQCGFPAETLEQKGVDTYALLDKIADFQFAIPS